MKKTAILLTVYNRKNITVKGLSTLFAALQNKYNEYVFDIFMVNDGCTDGTEYEVHKLYPQVNIINSKGDLFWSKGMNLAWHAAVKKDNYDYFMWFNDDAMLYDHSINDLFQCIIDLGDDIIVTGAFKDCYDNPSYGGRDKNNKILSPNGLYQEVYLMNGNLVLIPARVFKNIGFIDSHFHHGLGDWDYGLSAQKKGIKVVLTKGYVGETDRHDTKISAYLDANNTLVKRLKFLYSPIYSILCKTYYKKKHYGIFSAIKLYIATHFYTLFPKYYSHK